MVFRVIIPPDLAKGIARLAPELKSKIRAALDSLAEDPYQGKALQENLTGLRSYRVARYRIVYRIRKSVLEVHVVAIGHRGRVYQAITQ